MTDPPHFELVELGRLLIHEEIRVEAVAALSERIRRSGAVEQPILVAAGDYVILDGHHRYAALRSIGARRAPAWIVDYRDPGIRLDRWSEGPPITKEEVVARAKAHQPYPPKTTRHRLDAPLPARTTPLADLMRTA